MTTGAPDGVLMIQVAVTVENVPVVPAPAVEAAAGKVGRRTNATTGYLEVASWTVATGKVGDLKEILVLSSDYTLTYVKITVGSVVYATDWIVASALPIIFEDLKLAAGTVVKVECASTTGASITVDAAIVGKEIG
jgi:hypothetical protein